jgi:AcrR family transcriptional regulator
MFAVRGFHGVGMDEIGAAVGISGPALYRHFPGKDALLTAVLVPISERLLTEGRRRAEAAADPAAALDALVRWHTDFALGNPDVITVQDRELDNLPVEVAREVRRLQRSYVEEWVRVLLALDPGLDEPTTRAAVHSAFGLLNSTPHSAGGVSRDAMADLLRRMALAALAAAAPAPETEPEPQREEPEK